MHFLQARLRDILVCHACQNLHGVIVMTAKKFSGHSLGVDNSVCDLCRFRTDTDCYACGGSGSLFKSTDGGKTFKRLKALDQVPGNLYAVNFTSSTQGFILGNDGILLRCAVLNQPSVLQ